jgi:glycosyltransferase involved in cell wall biosynthesis
LKLSTISYLIDTLETVGGAEKHLFNLLNSLDRDRFKPIVFTLAEGGDLVDKIRSLNIRIEEVPIKRIYTPAAINKSKYIARVLKEENAKIIQTFHFASDILGPVLSKMANVPIVVSSRRDMGFKNKRRHIWAYKLVNPFVTRIIVNSKAVRFSVNIRENVPPQKMVIIYNGVNLKSFDPSTVNNNKLKAQLCLPCHAPVVGMIANLHPIKGYPDLLNAARFVINELSNTHFLIIGNGELKACLEKTATDLGIKDNIHFLGERTDIPEILSIIDISVLSSHSEGFSNTILESMAMEKPVIATKVGGNPEAIVHGVNGFLVMPGASKDLSDAILKLLNDHNLANSMGRYGRETVEKCFSQEKMVEKITGLYSQLLSEIKYND